MINFCNILACIALNVSYLPSGAHLRPFATDVT